MIVSYNWLQSYFFKKPLPSPEELGELFTFRAFEVEGIEKRTLASGATDTILDLKVLPDRAHYALSHRGVAYELAAALDMRKEDAMDEIVTLSPKLTAVTAFANDRLEIKNTQPSLCVRYMGRIIENVTVGDSPQWVRDRLEAIGQRSINSVVDAGNIVMFDCGQPLHAFDADKVKGAITVRLAKEGETMTTLDGKVITLTPAMLVIADDEAPLALAGIKGGTRAEITRDTKNIIIEAACFDAPSVRRTSTAVGIRNDSSKRFENGITPELAKDAMEDMSALIMSFSPEAKLAPVVDIYPVPAKATVIHFKGDFIRALLGVDIPNETIKTLLNRLDLTNGFGDDEFSLAVPFERLDITIPEDIAEEVGRLYGYDKIVSKVPKLVVHAASSVNKSFYYAQKVRTALVGLGFSEVFTPSLVKKGDIDIANPLASDKRSFRTDLTQNLVKALELNLHNAPLLGLDRVRIFEIGTTFNMKEGEHLSLAVGVVAQKGSKGERINDEIKQVRDSLLAALGSNAITLCTIDDSGGIISLAGKQIGSINNTDGIFELNLDALVAALPEPAPESASEQTQAMAPIIARYQPISPYPFALRDIAVFVPTEHSAVDVESVIREKATNLMVRLKLFDVFTKKFPDGSAKTSYAFSLVFQSYERTLGDDEMNAIMKTIYDAMTAKGWQIR